MAGRPPKPTHLKVVSGNPGKRALNKREPKPKREVPSCPAYLSDVGKVAWGRLGVLLDRMGVLTEADGPALERLCDCYSEILECRELIKEHGRTYSTIRGIGDERSPVEQVLMKANPAVAMLADADRRFKSYLVEFGLTPAARSKVNAAPDDDKKKDPLAEFFG
uniref:Phage terminase, small subunit, P27 family n=1 Tax=Variovorax paradoxus (strain S110) TaxID=543728 RepID=C5CJP3_VARPS